MSLMAASSNIAIGSNSCYLFFFFCHCELSCVSPPAKEARPFRTERSGGGEGREADSTDPLLSPLAGGRALNCFAPRNDKIREFVIGSWSYSFQRVLDAVHDHIDRR